MCVQTATILVGGSITMVKGGGKMDFMIHVESLNGNYQTITAIFLPDGTMITRDGETIDFEPMKEYVGNLFIFVRNGVADPSIKVLKSVETKEGIPVFSYDEYITHEKKEIFS